ncbi:hypothetical protein BDC45DRAFT_566631 [Circinella umbellata]|nr:hypothetical protein BDC45DRAFT_566631 [Circinella umbellata]
MQPLSEEEIDTRVSNLKKEVEKVIEEFKLKNKIKSSTTWKEIKPYYFMLYTSLEEQVGALVSLKACENHWRAHMAHIDFEFEFECGMNNNNNNHNEHYEKENKFEHEDEDDEGCPVLNNNKNTIILSTDDSTPEPENTFGISFNNSSDKSQENNKLDDEYGEEEDKEDKEQEQGR